MDPKADNQTGEGYLFNNQRNICAVQGDLIEGGEEGSVRKGLLEVMKIQCMQRSAVAGWVMVLGYQ